MGDASQPPLVLLKIFMIIIRRAVRQDRPFLFVKRGGDIGCKSADTAIVKNLANTTYGNFDLVGEDGASVYVYGLTTSFVAKNDKSFANLGLKEGDIVTLVGKRDIYNDQDQVGGPAYYISHEAGAPAVDPWEAEGVATYVLDEFMYTDYPQYCALTELKAYADETNLYARLKTTKNSGVAKFRLCTADTNEGTETVWYWEMTIPRAAHEHTSAAGAVNLGFVSYNAEGGENGLMPKVWGEMLKVTLPFFYYVEID